MSIITLPQRPLKLSRQARPAYFWALAGALFLMVIGLFLMVWQLPGIQHDWTISRNPVLVQDGTIKDAKCTTRKGVFTDCEAHLSYTVDGTPYETDVALMFVDFHSGDYTVDIVRSGDDPSLATMDIGIDKLWNRIILLAVLMLFTLGAGFALFLQGARNMRASGLLARAGMFEPIPVVIESSAMAGKRQQVTFSNPAGAKPKAKFASTFRKGEEPLIVQASSGVVYGVAVTRAGTPVPVLLDRGLMRLDLTASEREAALASVGA
ncbi:MAG: hypothetical protein ACRCS3_09905 [Paracoccaceae bacterium]